MVFFIGLFLLVAIIWESPVSAQEGETGKSLSQWQIHEFQGVQKL